MSAYRWKVFGLIGFTLVCVGTLAYLFTLAGGRIRLNEPYNANALVPDAFNIVNNSDVRVRGVTVGRVREITPDGGISKIKFEIEKKAGKPIYNDATVRVRTKTLVGESYIELNRGNPRTGQLKSGATLPLEDAQEAVPLERILNSLDEPTRKEIRRNLQGIGAGLDGHTKDLNEFLGAVRPTVVDGGRLMRVLKPQRQQLAALVENTGKVLGAFGERSADLRSLAIDAKQTAEAAAARDDKLAESIQELPSTLKRAQTSVNTLASFSTKATPVFRNLKTASVDLAPAIRDLQPTAADTRQLFKELTPFLSAVNPVLDQLTPAANSLTKTVTPLDATLRQLNPALSYLKDYRNEAASFFANVGSIFGTYDAVGARGRVFAMYGPNMLTNLSTAQRKLLDTFIEVGGAGLIKGTRINPYPKPGTIENPEDYTGEYPKVQEAGR